jgi:nucleotide-binding universal stress UspA family protein
MSEKASIFAPKSILCPLDLSAASRGVLAWAGLFAETYHSKLELLHAAWTEYPSYFLPSQAPQLEAEVRENRAVLTDNLAKLAAETLGHDTSPEIVVLEGHPIEKIMDRATLRKPDLIVMGSHGRSGITRLRLGSVAENVVRASLAPTLVVRAVADGPRPPRITRILCPVNFTESARGCLKASAEIARDFGARLLVMHAAEDKNADLKAAREQFCQWMPSEVRSNCDLVEVIRQGDAAEQILLAAREHGVDLIMLGAQPRRLFEFTILGSTTERVVRHADSAVLVVPRSHEDAA